MAKLTTDAPREIIDHFAKAIAERWKEPAKPAKGVINFRNEQKTGYERDIGEVPLGLLRYRKDNGRITSDVLSYEKQHGILKEDDVQSQKKLAEFLKNKDPEKTEILKKSIYHSGQKEPAIITADGFLINGNRRKVVLEMLCEEHPGKDEFKYMRVIMLPGKGDKGGPPTLKEIEQIENRYQLQTEGKAEYYNFDRALSIRSKIQKGMTIEEQLRDDPAYADLPKLQFKQAIRKFETEYLKPLECIDRYLDHLGRDGLYDTISSGIGDPEGRWQAFLDYSKVHQQFSDEKRRHKLGIKVNEVGVIEDVAFKIIRKRETSKFSSGRRTGLPKVHKIMLDLPKLFGQMENDKSIHAKHALLELKKLSLSLPHDLRFDKSGQEVAPREIDNRWGNEYGDQILGCLKRAFNVIEHVRDSEAPIGHLRTAHEELNHEDLQDPTDIGNEYCEEAERLSRDIKNRASALEKQFIEFRKELKGLPYKVHK